ncbi:hypothetical protein PSPO01_06924 [Paraphaeosphaeria sporulosa]
MPMATLFLQRLAPRPREPVVRRTACRPLCSHTVVRKTCRYQHAFNTFVRLWSVWRQCRQSLVRLLSSKLVFSIAIKRHLLSMSHASRYSSTCAGAK